MFTVLLVAGLLATSMAQTTEEPGFFEQIGNIFSSTLDAFTDTFTDYLQNTGQSMLNSVLPGLASDLLSGGLTSLFSAAASTGNTASPGKRNAFDVIQRLEAQVQQLVQRMEGQGEGLSLAAHSLGNSLLNGQVSRQEFLDFVPRLSNFAQNILDDFSADLLREVTQLVGNKRQVAGLSQLLEFIRNLQNEGQQVVSQFQQTLESLVDPQTLHAIAVAAGKK